MTFFLFAFITIFICTVYISISDIIILPFIRVHGFWLHVLVRLPTVRYIWFTFVYILKRNSLYLVCLHIRICMKTFVLVLKSFTKCRTIPLGCISVFTYNEGKCNTHTHTHTHIHTHTQSRTHARTHARTHTVSSLQLSVFAQVVTWYVSSMWSIAYRQCEV